MASFDLIRNTATELQELLSRGDITSTRLVKETLAQIDAHNHQGLKLRAVGRPFGLGVVAQAGREDLLIKFMSAYEAVSDPRPVLSSLRP
jgi:Asp-tRNA(Asn)/Glu-tRNA(Gln) amidotransferase A subunit family amidase